MDRSQCEDKAEEIRKLYNPNDLSPFPYENIVNATTNLNVKFFGFTGELASLSGAIYFDKEVGKFTIAINSLQTKTRQHFTLAHELGHYFLHQEKIEKDGIITDKEFFDGSRALLRANEPTGTSDEVEANQFAAALIMPRALVEKAWEKLKSIEECAKIFNVSVLAMTIRLEYFNLLPV